MPNINPKADFAAAKVWATSHLVAAIAIGAAVGFVLGLIVG